MKSERKAARQANEPEAPGRRRMLQKLGLFATAAYVAPSLLELDTAHAWWWHATRQSPPSRMSPPSRPSRMSPPSRPSRMSPPSRPSRPARGYYPY